jgi:hypothetical protein
MPHKIRNYVAVIPAKAGSGTTAKLSFLDHPDKPGDDFFLPGDDFFSYTTLKNSSLGKHHNIYFLLSICTTILQRLVFLGSFPSMVIFPLTKVLSTSYSHSIHIDHIEAWSCISLNKGGEMFRSKDGHNGLTDYLSIYLSIYLSSKHLPKRHIIKIRIQ